MPSFGLSRELLEAELARAKVEGRFYEDRRRRQALKKTYGIRGLRQRCKQVWVLDSESIALRDFSFDDTFDDYFAEISTDHSVGYRNVVTDHRDVFCGIPVAQRGLALTAGPLDALGQGDAVHIALNHTSFRTFDYWFIFPDVVEAMCALIESMHDRPFLSVYVEHASGLPVYYGVFAAVYLTPTLVAGRQPDPGAGAFLANFSSTLVDPLPMFVHQSLCTLITNALLSSLALVEYEALRSNNCTIHGQSIVTGEGVGPGAQRHYKTCSLSVALRGELLQTAFSWLHGHRFDRVAESQRADVAELFATTPQITCAQRNGKAYSLPFSC